MEAILKNSIKSNIKQVINSNNAKEIVLEVGFLGTELKYTSKREFGNRVLIQLDRDDVNNIIFKGIENDILKFKVAYINKSTFGNDRGYGQGRYMGD